MGVQKVASLFFEAKFVILGLFSTPLAFFYIWPFSATKIYYVDLADLKMILPGFWALAGF